MDVKQARLQAQDKNTPPEILTELASSQNLEVRYCVAKNPNTPAKTLAILCREFPDEVVANPIYDLLRSKDANIKFSILSSARSCKVSAEEFVEFANQKGTIILDANILNNPKTSGKTIDKIYDSNGRRLGLRLFLEHENTNDITLNKIVASYGYNSDFICDNKNLHQRIKEHPNASINTINISRLVSRDLTISSRILDELSEHKSASVRYKVCIHPNTATKTLNKLSLDDAEHIRKGVARHRHTSKNIILAWAINENPDICSAIAQRRTLSSEIANTLSNNSSSLVRTNLAKNPRTPSEIINRLAEDSSYYVRVAVAGRKDLSLENAMILAHDILWRVIEKLANNTNVLKISNIFSNLFHTLSASRQVRRLTGNSIHINHISIQKYSTVLSTIVIPEKVAKKIAATKSFYVRGLLARNLNLSISIFRKLSADSAVHVLISLTHNINTPSEILEELAKSKAALVRQRVAEHPQVTAEILDKLKSDRNVNVREQVANNFKISLQTIEDLSTDSSPLVRRAIANNPLTSVTILDELKSDSSQSVRLAIANNPHTSIDTLRELLKDKAIKIKCSARENYQKRHNSFDNLQERSP